MVEIVLSYSEWLQHSNIPKLFINAEPGAILVGKQREFCRSWPNQDEITVPGIHFIQEDSPQEIGNAIANWLKNPNVTADFSLNGQIALVTGASSGLGRSFAGFLAKAGASVVLAARNIDECAKAADQISGTTLPISIDVKDPTSINAAMRTIEQNFGTVTILINNAGTVTNNLLVETPTEDWRQVINTNLTGCFLMTQAISEEFDRV